MSGKKKNSRKDTTEKIVLATAILQLICVLVDLINRLTG